jgi:hypothetical protein
MQTTIHVRHQSTTGELISNPYESRVACMRHMCALLDAGIPFEVTHTPTGSMDSHPVRPVATHEFEFADL